MELAGLPAASGEAGVLPGVGVWGHIALGPGSVGAGGCADVLRGSRTLGKLFLSYWCLGWFLALFSSALAS